VILDLSAATGLPVSLDLETCRLLFHPPLPAMEPAMRPPHLLRAVYRNPGANVTRHPPAAQSTGTGARFDEYAREGLYFMYDGVALAQHRAAIAQAGLRYDLTVLRCLTIGDEPVKTLGHYHTAAPEGMPYPELYQVVFGRAHFVLQRACAPDYRVEQVVAVDAAAGDTVLMPPGWGHVSINAGDTPLVMCNWIAAACGTVPEPYLERRGAACYEVRGAAGLELTPNPRCAVPCPAAPRRASPETARLIAPGPIYAVGVADLDALSPLVQPTSFQWRAEDL